MEPGGDGVRLERLAASRWRCTPKAWVLPAPCPERAVFCDNRAFMQNRPLSALLQSPVSLNPHLTFGHWSHFHVFHVPDFCYQKLQRGTWTLWQFFFLQRTIWFAVVCGLHWQRAMHPVWCNIPVINHCCRYLNTSFRTKVISQQNEKWSCCLRTKKPLNTAWSVEHLRWPIAH